jgi:hypothetical protein
MKNFILSVLVAFTGFITLQSFGTIGFGKKDGTEPGYTGSPGDSLKNCTVCHGGTAVDVDSWIASDIPSTGFVPGERYTITATNTEVGATRFGFSVSPQALDGTMLGTMVITDTTETKLVGDDKYITYKAAGVEGLHSKSWSFDWIAPDSVNEVIFYGAFNSNHEGHKEGDKTYLSKLRVYKNGFTGLSESFHSSDIQVYPSLAINSVFVKLNTYSKVNIKVFGVNGQVVADFGSHDFATQTEKMLDVSAIKNGIYFVRITSESTNQLFTKRILINH